jgi:predicted phosphodiesterase
MKTLIIPDIHQRHSLARSIFERYVNEVDRVVFLGDFFDSFNETMYDVCMTAEFVREVIHHPKVVCLYGNHDISYRYNNNESYCPGYKKEKSYSINDILKFSEWSKFKYHHVEDGVVYSHAGFTKKLLLKHEINYDNQNLEEISEKTDECYRRNEPDFYTWVDNKRGGHFDFGGILWGDWEYLSLVENLNQVVGHTPQFYPQIATNLPENRKTQKICLKYHKDYARKLFKYEDGIWQLPSNFNLAMDCHLKYCAILENGKNLKLIQNYD